MPDVLVVLGDGAVAGEVAAPGDVHQGLPGPGGAVAVVQHGPVPGGDIVLHVQQGHEVVLALHVLPQGPQVGLVADGQQLGGDEKVHQGLDGGALIVLPGVVAVVGVQADDVIAGGAEGVDVLPTHQLGDPWCRW